MFEGETIVSALSLNFAFNALASLGSVGTWFVGWTVGFCMCFCLCSISLSTMCQGERKERGRADPGYWSLQGWRHESMRFPSLAQAYGRDVKSVAHATALLRYCCFDPLWGNVCLSFCLEGRLTDWNLPAVVTFLLVFSHVQLPASLCTCLLICETYCLHSTHLCIIFLI